MVHHRLLSSGVQRQSVRCIEKVAGGVEERYCEALSRPDDKQRSCSEAPCPARSAADSLGACCCLPQGRLP